MEIPNLNVTIEPLKSLGTISFLKCAPQVSTGKELGLLNIALTIKNKESAAIRINKIELEVMGSSTSKKTFNDLWPENDSLGVNSSSVWVQPEDYVFSLPAGPAHLKFKLYAVGFNAPFEMTQALWAHQSATPDGSYRFWAEVRDLRPGEFWNVNGSSHAQTDVQMFAYDVGVAVESGSGANGYLPNSDTSKNEAHRIWGKPIYAVGDGKVVHFRNDFPTNPRPLKGEEKYEVVFPDLYQKIVEIKDGNGNFFTISNGVETVLYAHMQPGSLNPKLLQAGATVKKGDFLGLAGNSGASSGPHLHIHVNKVSSTTQSWVAPALPMPMHNARAVIWSSVTQNVEEAAWVKLSGRGIPVAGCAVWPSDKPVTALKNMQVKYFSINEQGQVWVIRADNQVRLSNDRLPNLGLYFDVNPGGSAKELAVLGQKPYLIGMDNKVWEGLSDHWAPINGSPNTRRVSLDRSTGKLWVVTSDAKIMSFTPSSKAWVEHPGGGLAKDICAYQGVPYVIGMDDRIWRSAGANGWQALPGQGKAKKIAIDHQAGKLWVIGMNDGIWSHEGNGNWKEHAHEGRGKDIFVHDNLPYVIGLDDGLWRSAGKYGWQKLNLIEPA